MRLSTAFYERGDHAIFREDVRECMESDDATIKEMATDLRE